MSFGAVRLLPRAVEARLGGVSVAVTNDDPSDDEVHKALDAFSARGRRRRPGPAPTDFRLSRLHLLEASVTRRIEQRSERTHHRPGTVDLSERPLYDVLRDYKLGPHEKPVDRPIDLVRRGTVHLASCDCGNGRRQCADCKGMRYRPCEPAQTCTVCEGVTACTQLLKHGGLPSTPPRPVKPGRADRPQERVTCEACRTPDSACPGCRGWGKVRCTECEARGRIPCGPCKASGTVDCTTCKGHGSLTSWTAGRIEWVSRTRSVPPPVPRPRQVASELGSAGWREDRLGADDPLPDGLLPSHRSALEPELGVQPGEKEREVVLRRLTVVRATPPGSGNLELYVFRDVGGQLTVRRRVSEEGRRKALLAVAAAVALVVLVLLLAH
ncbi:MULTISPECIES: hypothetical protein [unclassified Streptomyces]|uniref:hypothetical protein n=1 Tax=unclassified Streptomyces TaxID=2593676 RepID=UPI00131CBB6B|nr:MULTISPECIES: hypothetical protein [unclassified Streptomyces]